MILFLQKIPEQVKLTGDGFAILGWVSALSGVLTNIIGLLAAIFSCAWAAIRLYETDTVQNWLKKHKHKGS